MADVASQWLHPFEKSTPAPIEMIEAGAFSTARIYLRR
jgi:hypothetical protein